MDIELLAPCNRKTCVTNSLVASLHPLPVYTHTTQKQEPPTLIRNPLLHRNMIVTGGLWLKSWTAMPPPPFPPAPTTPCNKTDSNSELFPEAAVVDTDLAVTPCNKRAWFQRLRSWQQKLHSIVMSMFERRAIHWRHHTRALTVPAVRGL